MANAIYDDKDYFVRPSDPSANARFNFLFKTARQGPVKGHYIQKLITDYGLQVSAQSPCVAISDAEGPSIALATIVHEDEDFDGIFTPKQVAAKGCSTPVNT
ncbi:MAG: hypothetical protein V1839_01050 [archaeon]